ncbi:acyltransferase 3 [Methylobacterium sp. 4-46]|uniref:acyltransferase family protein n=1 Tax=unclassified Methylobacterium TaxID=2615210 RepID=UPI000152E638|nr:MULTISPECIES: acyltransferase [Methylobacterium]ACA21031.1 acyltransferase 3 [Methylobacterium sp. 4-46]WFT80181.1 acyltransferase [Methylobacterium nodulans]
MPKEIIGIQYLRGMSALSVVFFHIELQLAHIYEGYKALESLQAGVDVFFVISGFVMYHSTNGGSALTGREFFVRRIIRIVPLYWLATLSMVSIIVFVPHLGQSVKSSFVNLDHLLASLFFFPVTSPVAPNLFLPLLPTGWTLNYEMFFYSLFAVAIACGARRQGRVVTIVVAALGALALVGILNDAPGPLGFYTDPIVLEFCFGMIAASVWRRWTIRSQPVACAVFVLACALIISLPIVDPAYRVLRFGLVAAALVFAAACISWRSFNFLKLMGDVSYTMYLSHMFVLAAVVQVWRRLGPQVGSGHIPILYTVAVLTVICGSIVVWRLIEKPIDAALKSALQRNWASTPDAAMS